MTGDVHPINFLFDGGGVALTSGKALRAIINYAFTVQGWYLMTDLSGSIQFDVQVRSLTDYPVTESIVGSSPPAVTNKQKGSDTTLAGWTLAFPADTVIVVSITSVATIQQANFALKIRET